MKRCRARHGPTQICPSARRAHTVGEWSAGHAHTPEPAKMGLGLLLQRELEDVSGISVEEAQAPELVGWAGWLQGDQYHGAGGGHAGAKGKGTARVQVLLVPALQLSLGAAG